MVTRVRLSKSRSCGFTFRVPWKHYKHVQAVSSTFGMDRALIHLSFEHTDGSSGSCDTVIN